MGMEFMNRNSTGRNHALTRPSRRLPSTCPEGLVADFGLWTEAQTSQIRHFMKKATYDRWLLGAFAWSLAVWFTACQSTPTRTAADLRRLQGYWEGDGREGNGPRLKCSITITGNALHFYRDTNYWFETTFTLPAGTAPQQLHATIKDASHRDHIGAVVFGIFKIEDGTLTLAALDHKAELPESFADEQYSLYELRKVHPKGGNAELLKNE